MRRAEEMLAKNITKVALAAAAVCGLSWPASAQETGLDSLHAQVRVRGKICMVDHFHSGSSNGQRSRKLAEQEAIRTWVDFTAWEYGDNWGSWRMAETRRVSCNQNAGGWACTLEARPCKPAGRTARRSR